MSDVDIHQWFVGIVDKINDGIERTVEEAMEYGDNAAKTFIETRGTGREWSRTYYKPGGGPRSASKPGRVWSGDMRADVEAETTRVGKNAVHGAFGWINHYEDYYGLQEEGFFHEWANVDVPAMNAIADAKDLTIMKLESDLDVMLRAI